MTKKLSAAQVKVLYHMAQGHKLYCATHVTPWLDGVPDKDNRFNLRVHTNTGFALLERDCIVRDDTDTTPWWRRDYAITDIGRNLLQDTGLPRQLVLEETDDGD